MILLVSAQHLVAEQQVRIGVSIDGAVEIWPIRIGRFEGEASESFPILNGGEGFGERFRFRHDLQAAIYQLASAVLEGRPYQLPLLMDKHWQGIGTRACFLPTGDAGPLAAAPGEDA
jgi:hypothetical protein